MQDRQTHITAEHPGEFAGPSADMLMVMARRGVGDGGDPFTNRRLRKMSEEF